MYVGKRRQEDVALCGDLRRRLRRSLRADLNLKLYHNLNPALHRASLDRKSVV